MAAASATQSFVLTTMRLGNQRSPALLMRSFLIRCLVVLLAFALIGGNAHARLHLTPAAQPATHAHHHHDHAEQQDQHKPQHDKGLRCCCDCLGCVSAYTLSPDLGGVAPVAFVITV